MKNPFTSPRLRRSIIVCVVGLVPTVALFLLAVAATALALPYKGCQWVLNRWILPANDRIERWIESAPEET